MPNRKPKSQATAARPRGSFRRRYDDLEAQRHALIQRLARLGDRVRAHPGYKRAGNLLNEKFRRSALAQRVAVLQAAAWLIDILEQLGPTL